MRGMRRDWARAARMAVIIRMPVSPVPPVDPAARPVLELLVLELPVISLAVQFLRLVGEFLRQIGRFLGLVGLQLGQVGPVLGLMRRGPGLMGSPLRLLLFLRVRPAAGQAGGLGGHIGRVVRHHGRLVGLLEPLPGAIGQLLGLLRRRPGPLQPLLRVLRVRACWLRPGFAVALGRASGLAVRFAGLGHALTGGALARLVLSHDDVLPGGSARVCPPR